jgi:hypothetical protein
MICIEDIADHKMKGIEDAVRLPCQPTWKTSQSWLQGELLRDLRVTEGQSYQETSQQDAMLDMQKSPPPTTWRRLRVSICYSIILWRAAVAK